MPEGTGLSEFARRFPDRFFDVGIAEPHAVTFAAGLATQGVRPVVAIYSTFLQRALDQIIHDVALQNLPVVFAIDRAGVVGTDGPTHHGAFDLAYLGCVPNVKIATPACLADLAQLLGQALGEPGPVALRYPRGAGEAELAPAPEDGIRRHQEAERPVVIAVAYGTLAARVAKACATVDPAGERVTCLSALWAKPHPAALLEALRGHPGARVLVFEDGCARGGAGESLLDEAGPRTGAARIVGYPDRFVPHGNPANLEERVGHSPGAIARALRDALT
jgi:1-deoxy-D-xylulose-5-phosphate synthase